MRYTNHGGICLYVKYNLVSQISLMRFDSDDGIWVSFSHTENIIFGGFYIPPHSSPYYNESLFSTINSRLKEFSKPCVLLGDFNAKIADFNSILSNPKFSYPYQSSNDRNFNVNILKSICVDNTLVILNNLKTFRKTFLGNFTFRQSTRWVSEMDLCILNPLLLPNILKFDIIRDLTLPSGHAILHLTFNAKMICNTKDLVERSSELLTEHNTVACVKKSIHYRMIDQSKFKNLMNISRPPILLNSELDIHQVINNINDQIYDVSSRSMKKGYKNFNTMISRWERLLKLNDPKQIWTAINWKGNISNIPVECPSDESFKEHLKTFLVRNRGRKR